MPRLSALQHELPLYGKWRVVGKLERQERYKENKDRTMDGEGTATTRSAANPPPNRPRHHELLSEIVVGTLSSSSERETCPWELHTHTQRLSPTPNIHAI